MAKFLTTLPENLGFYNLGTIETYPVGGSGPVAYGPTSYFGSDPLPARPGDSINTPQNLGAFTSSPVFQSIQLKNKHGGNSRSQSTFYKITLLRPRSIIITQNYSTTSYEQNTNRNTLISVYRIEDGTHRRELPINSDGYVFYETGLSYSDSGDDDSSFSYGSDYPATALPAGEYIFLITNDFRYLETIYSLTVTIANLDWRYDSEAATDFGNFGSDATTAYRTWDTSASYGAGWDSDTWNEMHPVDPVTAEIDFGFIITPPITTKTSGLGYTRAGVSP